jgi:hypothetical protein
MALCKVCGSNSAMTCSICGNGFHFECGVQLKNLGNKIFCGACVADMAVKVSLVTPEQVRLYLDKKKSRSFGF